VVVEGCADDQNFGNLVFVDSYSVLCQVLLKVNIISCVCKVVCAIIILVMALVSDQKNNRSSKKKRGNIEVLINYWKSRRV
jgi:hypothetical protein